MCRDGAMSAGVAISSGQMEDLSKVKTAGKTSRGGKPQIKK